MSMPLEGAQLMLDRPDNGPPFSNGNVWGLTRPALRNEYPPPRLGEARVERELAATLPVGFQTRHHSFFTT